jgi:transposase InsO family protein
MRRIDEGGPDALLQLPEPVNKFPDFVRYLVRRLKTLCPAMGKVRIADTLCRAGLHLGPTTVGRILKEDHRPSPGDDSDPSSQAASAKRPDHVWHVDLTTVPTSAGFWASWLPFSLPQQWPFCWWAAVVLDHYSRRVMAITVFRAPPTSEAVQNLLDGAIDKAGKAPKYLISDKGSQFWCPEFKDWCDRKDITPRFGAVGKKGSIAVIERFIRSLKKECLRIILVPLHARAILRELALFEIGTMSTGRIQGLLAERPPKSTADWSQPLSLRDSSQGRDGREMHGALLPRCRLRGIPVPLFGLRSAIKQAEDTCPSFL